MPYWPKYLDNHCLLVLQKSCWKRVVTPESASSRESYTWGV